MKTIVLITGCFIVLVIACHGQAIFKWPEDTAYAQEMNARYTDALKENDYTSAISPFKWLLEHAPDLNTALYINGEKIYRGLIREETNDSLLLKYQKEQLRLYDLRSSYHEEDLAKAMDRKAYFSFLYFQKQPEKHKELLQLFDNTFEINGHGVMKGNVAAYMQVIRLYQRSQGDLTEQEILKRYDNVSEIIIDKSYGADLQKMVDSILVELVEMDCELIKNQFAVPFMQDSADLAKAEKLFALSLAYGCSDLPAFLTAAVLKFKNKPSAPLAYYIAVVYEKKGNVHETEEYLFEAVKHSEEQEEQVKMVYELAKFYQRRGARQKSREAARKALALDDSFSQAYDLIGDLYWESNETCSGLVSKVRDRAIFIAAYEMYKKANNLEMMKQARAQFPSSDELFWENLEKGEVIHIGCWVNKDVVLQERPY